MFMGSEKIKLSLFTKLEEVFDDLADDWRQADEGHLYISRDVSAMSSYLRGKSFDVDLKHHHSIQRGCQKEKSSLGLFGL